MKEVKKRKQQALADFDPEDEYFGEDGTRAKGKSQKRVKEITDDDLDFLKARLYEEQLGKGVKTSRKELGLLPEEDESNEESWSGDLEEDFEFVDNPKKVKEEDEEGEEFVIRKRPLLSDYERGQQVRNQLEAWDNMLTLRMKLQPLLNMIDDLETRCTRAQRREQLEALNALSDSVEFFLSTDIGDSNITEGLLKNVAQVYADNHTPSLNLKTICKSGWQQVCDIFGPENISALNKLRSRAYNAGSYSDGDFYQNLLREWAERSENQASMGVLVLKRERKHREGVDPRATKGRKLNYEVHEKLCNYMVPRRATSRWSDAKIDDFFRSIIGGH